MLILRDSTGIQQVISDQRFFDEAGETAPRRNRLNYTGMIGANRQNLVRDLLPLIDQQNCKRFDPMSFTQRLSNSSLLFIAFVAALVSSVLISSTSTVVGQDTKPKKRPARSTVFWPDGVECDPNITTPKEHFGFDIGQRHLRHDQVASYLQKIATQTDRIKIRSYGQTHGKRPLLLLTITAPDNHKNIQRIRNQHRALSKPEKSGNINTSKLPVVINMGYGVHGDEPSATNTAPLVAYYLAAAKGKKIESWLRNCVILLDPSLNPDGFDRFARWANTFRGISPNSDPTHVEHNQGWPAGRVNYYWFDLNRDWLPLVHPESRGRMRWYHQWKPNVVLDFHEMGTSSTYFFQPGIPQRTNPLTPQANIDLTAEIATYHAKAFDKRGTLYLTQELFDDFYMGKGSTYPDLHGAIGILFEQGSSRGQVQESANGLVRFPDTIRNQFTTSLTSLQATSDMREKLLKYQREFYNQAIEKSKQAKSPYFAFRARGDHSRLQQFADTLLRHDIQCYWSEEDLQSGKTKLPKNTTLIVPAAQPEYRFIESLFDRRTRFKENIFYDVSAWTLPLAYNLESFGIQQADTAKMRLAKIGEKRARRLQVSEDDYAYIIDWRDSSAAECLAQLLKHKIKVKVAMEPFTAKIGKREQRFGFGTLVVPIGIQKSKRNIIIADLKLATQKGLPVFPVKTGMTPKGIDIGSNKMPVIDSPDLALIIGRGASTYECGEVWHAIDHRLKLPLTMIPEDRLSRADLSRYRKIIVTSGSYEKSRDKLTEWVRDGGTLIAIGRAAAVFEPKKESKEKPVAAEATKKEDGSIQKPFANARNDRALQLISGSILQARVDRTHPLAFGITTSTLPVFRNHTSSIAPSSNAYQNPLVYDQENVLLSGYVSDENVEKLKGKASAVVVPTGRGRIILLSDNPNFRGFWEGSRRVFYNSLFFGQLAR